MGPNSKEHSTQRRPMKWQNQKRRPKNNNIPTPILPASTTPVTTPVVIPVVVLLNAQPATACRQEVLPTQPSSRMTVSPALLVAATLLLTLSHVQLVSSLSPVEELVQKIMASNRTSEEKFQAVLLLQHGRYCGSSLLCQHSNSGAGRCGYCKPCQCDDLCLRYGDCCPDKLVQKVKVVSPLEVKWACRDNLYAGYTAEQRQSRLTNATSFLMTASCPPSTPRHLVDACGDQSKYLPVSVRSSDGKGDVTVFANTFCAQCHGVDVFSAIPWKTIVHCRSARNFTSTTAQDIAREAAADDDCFLVNFPPPSLPPPRQCYYDRTIISTCNVTGTWPARDQFVERACGAYLDPKVAEGKVFQNVFCFICNSAEPQLFTKCDRNLGLDPMPFSALLDFSGALYGRRGARLPARCAEGEIYDDTIDECRAVLCAPRRRYMDGYCSAIYDSAKGLGYSVYFSVPLRHDLHLYDGNDLLHTLPGHLESLLISRTLGSTVRATNFEVSFEITDVAGRCSQKSRLFSVFCTVKVVGQVKQKDFEEQLLNLRNTTLSLRLYPGTFLNITTQVDELVWLAEKFRMTDHRGTACSTRVSNHHDVLPGDADTVYTRVHNLLTLPKVALRRDEFHVRSSNRGLLVPWLEQEIPLERYESTADGNVYISLDDFLPKLEAYRQALEDPDEAEVILSVVCTSLSLAGLALTFFTYVVFKPLRTAPGKNNMNLCLTLFLAQLFYLVGSGRTEDPGLCQAMGILIHYLWLAAFAAMSVCSYHMWRVFTSMKTANDGNDQRRRFLQYTVYIWGASAAVVVLTLLAHLIATEGDAIGYGGHRCYLSTSLGVAVAVGVPVALTITSSIVFFSLTVWTIRQSPKLTKSREDERHVWVYIKLSTLTGITWALAFVVFFTEVVVLRYVFTVVNGLQGIFICISFVFNRRVARFYLGCCRGGYPRLTSTTSGTASSSYRNTSMSTISGKTETSFTSAAAVVKT